MTKPQQYQIQLQLNERDLDHFAMEALQKSALHYDQFQAWQVIEKMHQEDKDTLTLTEIFSHDIAETIAVNCRLIMEKRWEYENTAGLPEFNAVPSVK